MTCVGRSAPRRVGEGRRERHADPKGMGASHTCAPQQAPHLLQPGSGRGGAWQDGVALPACRPAGQRLLIPVLCGGLSLVLAPREILERYTVSIAVSGFTLRKPPFRMKVKVAQSC